MAGKIKQEGILHGYFQQFLSFIFSGIEEHAVGFLERSIGSLDIKKRIQQYVIFLVLLVTAFVVFFNGLSVFLGSFFPAVAPGFIPTVLGFVLILAALVFRKLYGH